MNSENLNVSPFKWKFHSDLLEMKIRPSIFIIAGVCAGLPALVWAVSDIIHHRNNGHRISVFIILLLITDFIEIFLSPYILIKDLLNKMSWYTNGKFWEVLLSSARGCCFLLNLLVAIKEILSIFSRFTARCFSPCFRTFYILLLLLITIGSFYLYLMSLQSMKISIFTSSLLEIAWLIFAGALCFADPHSNSPGRLDPHILAVFTFSLLNYLNYLLPFILEFSLFPVIFPASLLSLRLISDPLLCVLVCRQNLSLQTSQNPEETSSV